MYVSSIVGNACTIFWHIVHISTLYLLDIYDWKSRNFSWEFIWKYRLKERSYEIKETTTKIIIIFLFIHTNSSHWRLSGQFSKYNKVYFKTYICQQRHIGDGFFENVFARSKPLVYSSAKILHTHRVLLIPRDVDAAWNRFSQPADVRRLIEVHLALVLLYIFD